MKKESIKKKLSIKKTFVANLNQEAAQSIKGGGGAAAPGHNDVDTSGILICDIPTF